MPYSSLAYRSVPKQGDTGGSVIPLHGNHGSLTDLLPLASAVVCGRRIEAPEAARGIYEFRTRVSSSWYGGSDPHRPDPVSFGDSLAQLERFIYDVQNRAGETAPKPWLLGYEQGAVLASTIALIAPDLISGVIAIDGGLPTFSNQDLLEPMEGDLPIFFIVDAQQEERSANVEASASQLKRLGHQVRVDRMAISTSADSPAADVAREFMQAHGQN